MDQTGLLTLKKRPGHKTLEMTMPHAHLLQPHRKKAVETVGAVPGGHYLDTEADKSVSARFGTDA
jgi:hypothetical protein